MGLLAIVSQVGTIIQTLIRIKNHTADKKHIETLEKITSALEKKGGIPIERRELYSIIKTGTNNNSDINQKISKELFGSYDSVRLANEVVRRYYKKKNTKELKHFEFKENDFTFSSYGTIGYLKKLKDDKTTIVYHANGDDRGRLFLVRWGVGWFYINKLDNYSFLGFPISNEYLTNKNGRTGSKSDFEGGYIEYLEEFDKLRIYRVAHKGTKLLSEHQF